MKRRNFLLASGAAVAAAVAAALGGRSWRRDRRRRRHQEEELQRAYDGPATQLGQLDSNAVFDVCIVGSGPAGVVLGRELAKSGLQTLIVEAGVGPSAMARDPRYASLNRAEVTGDAEYPLVRTRVMMPGGTTAIWDGNCPRLRPIDFAPNSYTPPDCHWPIGYDTIEPFYALAERTLAVRGDGAGYGIPRSTALPRDSEGNELIKALLADVGIKSINTFRSVSHDGMAVRVGRDLLPTFVSMPSATLLTGVTARNFISAEDGSVAAVRVRDLGGSERTLRARVYVLAAGAVESARRLLLSRSPQHPNGLGNDSGQVGRYFQEHPFLTFTGQISIARSDDKQLRQLVRSYSFYEQLKQEGVGGTVLVASLRRENARATRAELGFRAVFEVYPHSDNRVTLSRTQTDIHGDPLSHLHLQFSANDRATMERCRSLIADCFGRFRATNIQESASIEWGHHHIGTTRMGTDPKTSVADANLHVHGTRNLYVLTSGLWVTAGAANPTLLIVALAYRLADHLRAQLAQGTFTAVV